MKNVIGFALYFLTENLIVQKDIKEDHNITHYMHIQINCVNTWIIGFIIATPAKQTHE